MNRDTKLRPEHGAEAMVRGVRKEQSGKEVGRGQERESQLELGAHYDGPQDVSTEGGSENPTITCFCCEDPVPHILMTWPVSPLCPAVG